MPAPQADRRLKRSRLQFRRRRRIALLPAGVGAGIGFACLLIVGIVVLRHGRPVESAAGFLTVLGGLAGLFWQIEKLYRRWQARRTQRAAAEQQALRKSARQVRDERERELRRKRSAEQELTKQRTEKAQEQRRALLRQEEADGEASRRAKEARVSAEAGRLMALGDREVTGVAEAVFSGQGYEVLRVADEADSDLILSLSGTACAVCRRIPRQRRATASDVLALDAWRADTEAPRAFLIALDGFSAEAVRAAAGRPVTLVEAHLLAQWRIDRE